MKNENKNEKRLLSQGFFFVIPGGGISRMGRMVSGMGHWQFIGAFSFSEKEKKGKEEEKKKKIESKNK